MTHPRPTYEILPITSEDLPTLSAISQAAFAGDAHTSMKMAEKGSTDMASELEPLEFIAARLGKPGVHMFKAVDGGEMVGFSGWKEWNFDKELAPRDTTALPLSAPVSNPDFPILASDPPLKQLGNTTSGHLFALQARANRPDTRTLFCTGISTAPSHHGMGVASALLAHVTRIADDAGARMWVHLSDHPGGVRAFQKAGFAVVNDNAVDLDKFATKEKEGGGKWGLYTFHFMVREPRPRAAE